MCGRYTMGDPRRCIAEFSILEKEPALEPRFNIAPSQGVWVVRVVPVGNARGEAGAGEARRLDLLRWGLVRKAAGGLAMVRAESLATRSAFAEAFRRRRCLFLADGFYEWRKGGGRSFPYLLHRPGGAPFVMAGIWYPAPAARAEETAPLDSCAVITLPARPPVDAVHDRMPAILAQQDHDAWLDPDFGDTAALTKILEREPGFALEAVPVGPRVNSPANDDPSCIAPATDAERRGEQFDLFPAKAFRAG